MTMVCLCLQSPPTSGHGNTGHEWDHRAWSAFPPRAQLLSQDLENRLPHPSSEDPQESLQRRARLPGFLGLFAVTGPARALPDKGGTQAASLRLTLSPGQELAMLSLGDTHHQLAPRVLETA